MPTEQDFLDRIVEAFQSLRSRSGFRVIEQQFHSGELTFIVDHNGIRIHLSEIDLEQESSDNFEEMEM